MRGAAGLVARSATSARKGRGVNSRVGRARLEAIPRPRGLLTTPLARETESGLQACSPLCRFAEP